MRKIFTFLIGLTIAFGVEAAAPESGGVLSSKSVCLNSAEEYPFESDMTPNDIMKGKVTLVSKDGQIIESPEAMDTPRRNSIRKEEEELVSLTVEVPEGGKLLEMLGEHLETVEALTVTGQINDEDFNTLWHAGYYGELIELDLGAAHMEGDSIPDFAMFHMDVQFEYSTGIIHCLGITKLILPSNVTHIGRLAFGYFIDLVELRFPEALYSVGNASFTDCISLPNSAFHLPEGIEFIGYQAFYQCYKLAGEIVFPQSLRYLLGASFYNCRLTKVTFPETLEGIGFAEFYGCRFTEVYIPDDCFLDPQGWQFLGNHFMKKIHLPDNSIYVPTAILESCEELEEVNMPSKVLYILEDALDTAELVTDINFPEGLLSIGARAFVMCDFETLDFPSTLQEVGGASFGECLRVRSISCKAILPPICTSDNYLFRGYCPFGDYVNHTIGINRDIPVYVPIGTKEIYENTWGWDYFTNFIETDFSTGIDEVTDKDQQPKSASPIYDIQGKNVKEPVPGHIYIRGGKKELITK